MCSLCSLWLNPPQLRCSDLAGRVIRLRSEIGKLEPGGDDTGVRDVFQEPRLDPFSLRIQPLAPSFRRSDHRPSSSAIRARNGPKTASTAAALYRGVTYCGPFQSNPTTSIRKRRSTRSRKSPCTHCSHKSARSLPQPSPIPKSSPAPDSGNPRYWFGPFSPDLRKRGFFSGDDFWRSNPLAPRAQTTALESGVAIRGGMPLFQGLGRIATLIRRIP